jgi:flavin reductase (DIM6/NTAB) family NADH-FMN oxidoreductase RutF
VSLPHGDALLFPTPNVCDAPTTNRIGLPLLREALAWFECQVVGEHPAGDHVLVLGEVINGKLLDSEAEPMTYRQTGAMDGAAELFPDVFDD